MLFLETVWTLLQTLKSCLGSSSLTEKGGWVSARYFKMGEKGGTHLRAIDWYQMGGGSGLRLVRGSGLTLVVGRHVTIGTVLFSGPIAFVDVVIRRTYFNLMIFCFTWLWIVWMKRLRNKITEFRIQTIFCLTWHKLAKCNGTT